MLLSDLRSHFRSTWQSEFSLAHVLAVASAAGVACEFHRVDIFGIDVTLITRVPDGMYPTPKLDVQIKSWTTPDEDDGCFRYPLEADNYKKLVERQQIPQILVLVVLPPTREDWFNADDDQARMRHCAYWKSLKDLPPSGNTSTKTIYIPKQDQFSVDALSKMMELIANGGRP